MNHFLKKYRTIFFGTPDFAVPILKELTTFLYLDLLLVITQPDKPIGRNLKLTPPPVKVFAENKGIPIFQPEKIKTAEFAKKLKQLAPDVIILVAYGKIIPVNLLEIPKFGWLNIHASLLPKFRGASPIQAAILEGKQKTGITLMKIDEGLDTGPIIAQKSLKIDQNDNFEALHDKLAKLGADLVKEALLDYLKGKIIPQPQAEETATLTKIIKKEDGKIDWSNKANYIEKQIRAYTPWPGAYCFWNNKRLKIIEASVSTVTTPLSKGEIKGIDNKILVGTVKENLELKKIQLEGKIPLSISEFLKGYPDFDKVKLE